MPWDDVGWDGVQGVGREEVWMTECHEGELQVDHQPQGDDSQMVHQLQASWHDPDVDVKILRGNQEECLDGR